MGIDIAQVIVVEILLILVLDLVHFHYLKYNYKTTVVNTIIS